MSYSGFKATHCRFQLVPFRAFVGGKPFLYAKRELITMVKQPWITDLNWIWKILTQRSNGYHASGRKRKIDLDGGPTLANVSGVLYGRITARKGMPGNHFPMNRHGCVFTVGGRMGWVVSRMKPRRCALEWQ